MMWRKILDEKKRSEAPRDTGVPLYAEIHPPPLRPPEKKNPPEYDPTVDFSVDMTITYL